jgi:hypothetical protein
MSYYYQDDGCFIDASLVLTKEEYSTKVLFDKRLLESIHHDVDSKDIFDKLDLPYVELNEAAIAFDFGDLLTYVPILERLKWTEFYRGIIITTDDSTTSTSSIQTDMANKLLFYDYESKEDLDSVVRYWQSRIDENE